jgi:inosine-uridine nucleoside N-ribohydrolase
MKRIILDCDPGIDDALALLLAFKSGRVILAGVTTVSGNVSVEQTTKNACRLLDYAGADVPVAKGAARPLRVPPLHGERVHGKDGLGDSPLLPPSSQRRLEREDAAGFILDCVRSGVETIVATGPLTNIALSFQRDEKTMGGVKELIIMGGAVRVAGNVDSISEFNFYADPDAADYVLQRTGVRKVLVPLDVTHQVIMTPARLSRIGDSPTGRLAKSILRTYVRRYRGEGLPGSPLHDPLAIGYCLDETFLRLRPMFLRVETTGTYTRGACVPEERVLAHRRPNVSVALGVDSERFLDYFEDVLSK